MMEEGTFVALDNNTYLKTHTIDHKGRLKVELKVFWIVKEEAETGVAMVERNEGGGSEVGRWGDTV